VRNLGGASRIACQRLAQHVQDEAPADGNIRYSWDITKAMHDVGRIFAPAGSQFAYRPMRVFLTLDDSVRPRYNVIDYYGADFQRASKRLGLRADLVCGRSRVH